MLFWDLAIFLQKGMGFVGVRGGESSAAFLVSGAANGLGDAGRVYRVS